MESLARLGVLGENADMSLDGSGQALGSAPRLLECPPHCISHGVEHDPENVGQNFVLTLEVVVEGCLRHAGGCGDVLDPWCHPAPAQRKAPPPA